MTDDELKALFDRQAAENRRSAEETQRAVDGMRQSVAETRRELRETAEALVARFDSAVEEVRAEGAETRREFRETTEALGTRFDSAVAEMRADGAETRRHFDVTAERWEKRFDGLAEAVALVDEKLDREAADIRTEMRRGFADTQAMIKFSHAELDRRVLALESGQRSLEESVAELQARVDRIESSTH